MKPTGLILRILMALALAAGILPLILVPSFGASPPGEPPTVVEISLDDIIEPVTAEYIKRGIDDANHIGAEAVLLELSTP
ncbi:MAG: hypothetical protein ACREP9_08985, partial [Candidatus Dormibacteraceae bacterium]